MRYRYWFHYTFFVIDGKGKERFVARMQIYRNLPIASVEDLIGVENYIQSTLQVGATPIDVDNWKLLAYRDDESAEWKPVLG